MITTDQQRFDTIQALGNDRIFTPHLNWMLSRKILFENIAKYSKDVIDDNGELIVLPIPQNETDVKNKWFGFHTTKCEDDKNPDNETLIGLSAVEEIMKNDSVTIRLSDEQKTFIKNHLNDEGTALNKVLNEFAPKIKLGTPSKEETRGLIDSIFPNDLEDGTSITDDDIQGVLDVAGIAWSFPSYEEGKDSTIYMPEIKASDEWRAWVGHEVFHQVMYGLDDKNINALIKEQFRAYEFPSYNPYTDKTAEEFRAREFQNDYESLVY